MEDARVIKRFPKGIVVPPPSKSLSHRALICAALAAKCAAQAAFEKRAALAARCTAQAFEMRAAQAPGSIADKGESLIFNIGDSEDVSATLGAIRALGANASREGRALRVRPAGGIGGGCEPIDRQTWLIDCGESGSTLRFLIPIMALDEKETVFVGRGRLLDRPLDIYSSVFAEAGAEMVREAGSVRVAGPLRSGVFALPGDVSSQFVSGLLFALPLLDGDSEIRLSAPLQSSGYVDMTMEVMGRFGVKAERAGDAGFTVRGRQRYRAAEYAVEADYSQAAYFLGAAALGCDLWCGGLDPGSIQGDRAILGVLEEMGADIIWKDGLVTARGRSPSRAGKLSAIKLDAREIPDLVPPIAALCCFCEGRSEIVNAARLRFKESDRLSAMATELEKLGAKVWEGEDSLVIEGTETLRGGNADSWGDHRIAMSLALAAVSCDGPVALTGWRSVNKSYPGFWEDFEKVESLGRADQPGGFRGGFEKVESLGRANRPGGFRGGFEKEGR